jgi:hypothetical protein
MFNNTVPSCPSSVSLVRHWQADGRSVKRSFLLRRQNTRRSNSRWKLKHAIFTFTSTSPDTSLPSTRKPYIYTTDRSGGGMRITPIHFRQVLRQYIFPLERPPRIKPSFWRTLGYLRIRIIGQPSVVLNDSIKKSLNAMCVSPHSPTARADASGRRRVTMLSTLAASLGYTGLGQRPKPRSKVSRGRSYWLMRRVQLMPRPKFKKFPTEASAKAFLNTDRSAPYSLPTRTHGASASASSSASRSSEAGPSKRVHSPLTSVDPSLLPPHLKAIADAGYTFRSEQWETSCARGTGRALGNWGRSSQAESE